ncbi:esterase/lipase family protein [Kitasatospora griseola]|uniref:esterase/lipase family protein n=1 Tax=Kitasatospora griseola TaxID=2064 RepID=UPI00381BC937
MIKVLQQSAFGEMPFNSTSMNLHVHAKSSTSDVVVFIHGLAGEGYGTWGKKPQMVFDGTYGDAIDVAVLDYPSGFRALPKRGSDLVAPVSQLAAALADLGNIYGYDSVYIAAHSLGGLVSQAALIKYLQGPGTPLITPISAVIFFASPRAGSGWAIKPMRENRFLRRMSQVLADHDEYFSTHVETRVSTSPGPGRFIIPHYACVASSDRFVSNFSAGVGIPTSQRIMLKGSHTSISKPSADDHPQVEWFYRSRREVSELRDFLRAPKQLNRDSTAAPGIVIAELRTDIFGTQWESVYNDVRQGLSSPSIYVQDRRDNLKSPTDVLIVIRSTEAILGDSGRSREEILRAHQEQEVEGDRRLVGICIVGDDADTAIDAIGSWLPSQAKGSFFVSSAKDISGVYMAMREWIEVVISRDPQRLQGSSRMNKILGVGPDPLEFPGKDLL